MSDNSHIEWTDATWNPTTGCTKVSDGCRHCYIDRTPPFRINKITFDKGEEIGATTGVQLHPDRLEQPLRWKRPRRVFVDSLSDLFHDDVPDEFIALVWLVMSEAMWTYSMKPYEKRPGHIFQVLTKRPRRMLHFVRDIWPNEERLFPLLFRAQERWPNDEAPWDMAEDLPPVLPNVWLGTSVEDQKAANLRIPLLCETPAAVRFLSCEPLLGPVDLRCAASAEIAGGRLGIDYLARDAMHVD